MNLRREIEAFADRTEEHLWMPLSVAAGVSKVPSPRDEGQRGSRRRSL